METTLVLVKPDGVQRGRIGTIVARFEAKGLKLVGMKLMRPDRKLLETHYAVHSARPFFGSLLKFMSAGPVVAMALAGEGAIGVVRTLVGPTNGAEAAPGTIRGDYGMSKSFNLIHASDGAETATSELALWFPEGTLDYDLASLGWVYDPE
ncbi:MAG: nucleoside-diphosphate kinase [Planctomycetota bacterium]|nr:nucleoside-diphosphate kinase [Planctomycetota bacterium]